MQQNHRADVVTIGESMVLFQPMGEKGIKYESLFTKSLAGAESNVAIGLTRLGKNVRWISKVGNDPFGDFILSTLAGEGVDVSHALRDEGSPTAVYFKETKAFGDPTVYYYRKNSAASKLEPSDVGPEWLEGARHLHVTGITPALSENAAAAIRKTMELAREMGLTISLDPNLRRKLWSEEQARRVLLSLIPLCDVFLPGVEEADFLIGKQSIEDYGKQFLEMGPKVVAVKLGAEGSIGFIEGNSMKAAPHAVQQVIDTVGAGDAFAAGFVSVFLDNQTSMTPASLEKALNRANIMGALATQFKGDWEGIPALEELEAIGSGKVEVKR
ncbi:sugar kinase [Neobacillus drentensis]|uniref:sugar kinase n=1 Tax=Neobacillus drentensis TaxID=220684 RepID=UPI001F2EFC2E|nr:sugar kinase [Neobacillus drentensis]ULT57021.1 sugar kinase [Neobacillus drentensis]